MAKIEELLKKLTCYAKIIDRGWGFYYKSMLFRISFVCKPLKKAHYLRKVNTSLLGLKYIFVAL